MHIFRSRSFVTYRRVWRRDTHRASPNAYSRIQVVKEGGGLLPCFQLFEHLLELRLRIQKYVDGRLVGNVE